MTISAQTSSWQSQKLGPARYAHTSYGAEFGRLFWGCPEGCSWQSQKMNPPRNTHTSYGAEFGRLFWGCPGGCSWQSQKMNPARSAHTSYLLSGGPLCPSRNFGRYQGFHKGEDQHEHRHQQTTSRKHNRACFVRLKPINKTPVSTPKGLGIGTQKPCRSKTSATKCQRADDNGVTNAVPSEALPAPSADTLSSASGITSSPPPAAPADSVPPKVSGMPVSGI